MAAPGFSLSEISEAFKLVYDIRRELKGAPEELAWISKKSDWGNRALQRLQANLNVAEERPQPEDSSLVTICREYAKLLKQLEAFIKKHQPVSTGRFQSKAKWVIDRRFKLTVTDLQRKLDDIQSAVQTELQLDTHERVSRQDSFLRSTSSVSAAITHQRPETITNHASYRPDEDLSTLTRPEASVGIIPETSFQWQIPDPFRRPSNYPSSSTELGQIEYTPNTQNVAYRTREISDSIVSTEPPSVFSSASSVSTVATRLSAGAISPTTLASDVYSDQTCFPQPVLRRSNTITASQGGAEPTARLQASLDYSSVSNTILRQSTFAKANLRMRGEVKVWSREAGRRVLRMVKSLEVEKTPGGETESIRMTLGDNISIRHQSGSSGVKLVSSFRQQHKQCLDHVLQYDPCGVYLVTFEGAHELYGAAQTSPYARGMVEYSFSDEQDCKEFQSEVASKRLLLNADIEKVECVDDDGGWSVLQLWEDQVGRSIRFYLDRKRFMEYPTSDLDVYDEKKSKASELKLKVKQGCDDIAGIQKLKIKFSQDGVGRKRRNSSAKGSRRSFTHQSTKAAGKRPAIEADQETVKERFIRLAQFGAG